jgi:hypothetical protein
MISPWGMRGKGMGSLIGRWCLRVPSPRGPLDSSRQLDRVRKGPGLATCLIPGRSGSLFAAARQVRLAPLRPLGSLGRPTVQGWAGWTDAALAPLGPPPPIYLRTPCARGNPRGEGAGVPRSTTALAARTRSFAVEGNAAVGRCVVTDEDDPKRLFAQASSCKRQGYNHWHQTAIRDPNWCSRTVTIFRCSIAFRNLAAVLAKIDISP